MQSLTVMVANFCHLYRPSWSFACGDYSLGKVWRATLFCVDKCLQLDNYGRMTRQQYCQMGHCMWMRPRGPNSWRLTCRSLDSAAEFVFYSQISEKIFLQVHCGELWAQFFGVCIPPPGFCEAVPGEAEAAPSGSSDSPHQFLCDCGNDDGSA
eukprot:s240_g28.t1